MRSRLSLTSCSLSRTGLCTKTSSKLVYVKYVNMHVCVDRRNLLDIEALRQAVKKEAGSLQTQLDELVCHYDESLKQVRLVFPGVFSS